MGRCTEKEKSLLYQLVHRETYELNRTKAYVYTYMFMKEQISKLKMCDHQSGYNILNISQYKF